MSHSSGKVYFNDGAVLWFEYNGTADIVQPHLYKTIEELQAHWRREDWAECTCGRPPEPVIIEWHYGDGMHVPGYACRKCMVITGPLDPWETNYEDLVGGPYRPEEAPK
jgi:hypothetical protein